MKKSKNYLFYSLIRVFVLSLLLVSLLPNVLASSPPTENVEETNSYDLETYNQLVDFYKNESENYKNLYENESVNVTVKSINDIKNEVFILNQNILQVDQQITSIENKINIITFAVAITLIEALFSLKSTIKAYFYKKREN
jgi:hypothetical protein